MPIRLSWLLTLVLLLAWALPAVAQAPLRTRSLRSGNPGFGFSAMSGSIGYGYGYRSYGYYFVPTLGFQPAWGYRGAPYLYFPRSISMTRAELALHTALLDIHTPQPAELWIDGHRVGRVGEDEIRTPLLEQGTDTFLRVKAIWRDKGRSVEQTRWVKARPGEKVAVDFGPAEGGKGS